MKCRAKGFTLIELTAILAISAVFLFLAIPGYNRLVANSKLVATTNHLSATLQYARMEAVRRGISVSVCSAGNASFTACGTNNQWQEGWIVFTDEHHTNTIDSLNDLLKIAGALPQEVLVSSNSAIITYNGSGFLSSGAASITVSTSGCTGNHARRVTVSSSGRVSIDRVACH